MRPTLAVLTLLLASCGAPVPADTVTCRSVTVTDEPDRACEAATLADCSDGSTYVLDCSSYTNTGMCRCREGDVVLGVMYYDSGCATDMSDPAMLRAAFKACGYDVRVSP